jgi:sulfide:quinone oxidoreductase
MKRKHIVVVGSSFAGFTAALELKKELGDRHDVTVIAKSDRCVFIPSLVGVPFGLHSTGEITFMTRPPLEQLGVRFRHDEVTRLSLQNRTVTTKRGDEHYDYLGPQTQLRRDPGSRASRLYAIHHDVGRC